MHRRHAATTTEVVADTPHMLHCQIIQCKQVLMSRGVRPFAFLFAMPCLVISSRSRLLSAVIFASSSAGVSLPLGWAGGGCMRGAVFIRPPRSAVQSLKVRDDLLAASSDMSHVDSRESHVTGKGAAADLSLKNEDQLPCASLNAS